MRTDWQAELIDETMTFHRELIKAVRTLKRAKAWRGTFDERWKKLKACFDAIARLWGLEGWDMVHVGRKTGCSGASTVRPNLKRVQLTGRLSVVTMFQLLCKARQLNRKGSLDHIKAMKWSLSLFKRYFPVSFSRCRLTPDGLLVNDGRRD